MNPVADADQGERATVLVVGEVGTDPSADPGGVDLGNAGAVHDQPAGLLGADGVLEPDQRLLGR
ncbi:MAG TPA: hypothetical protein VE083_05830 [Terriglobales bacterium]|nr:hypothetical protein [Terriglobales bacterium]